MIGQIVIGLFGVAAVFLSQDPREQRRRWACVFGLAAQPFWLVMAWHAHEYGVLALSLVYGWAWARGVRSYWMKADAR
ncbi:conserved hypothetical protein [Paraburkholderia piptadeniae]|uniref:Uncharacterized protein n=2 Tax=Paraburkholderia TaxID=1822464 RepID=A0A7X1NH11_9BURK|nr:MULTISPECIES: hypothetical protein [Paraburkholderia]MPW21727.1 hypothetical protein [Paraburkholderia franconis]SIT51849.1 conserved hypothetical protein [Paraburkholderia piptadeniae]